ncbi:MAG: hypothetical protein KatS3mg051_1450 [Anaerolineae bacterium]|nr:MAG: hypothetical protein KatS3mg051_1450 [Anaerolineae bacterium]
MANVVETIYRFRADRAATAEVLRDNARIADTLADIERAAERVRGAYGELESTGVRAAQARIEALRTELRLAKEQADIYGDVGRRLIPLAGLTAGVGGAALSGRLMIAADILDSVEALKLMRAELPVFAAQLGIGRNELMALGAAGAALAVSLVAVKEVFGDIAEASNRVKGLVAGQIDAYRRFSDFMIDATSESLKAEIEAVMKRDLADREYYANIQALQARVQAALDEGRGLNLEGLAEGAIQLYEALGGNLTGLKDLNAALNEAAASIESNRLYLQLLVDAYTEGATAANDAAAREREYRERQIAGLEAQMQRELEFQRLRQTATSQQIEERLAAIEQERAALQRLEAELAPLAAESEAAAQRLQQTRDRLAELGLEAQGLQQTVLPAVRAMEQWRSGIEAMRSGVQGALQTVAQTAQRLRSGAEIIARADYEAEQIRAEAAAERERAEQQHQQRLMALHEQYATQRAEAERRYREQVVELERGLEESLSRLRADYLRDEQRRAEDFQRDRERAERQHRTSLLDAAARLDASAVLQEQRRYAEEERQAREEFEVETRRRAEELQLREEQEREAFRDRLEQAQRAYNEQLRREREQYQRSLAQQHAAFQAELRQLDSALRSKLAANQSAMQRELAQLFGFQNTEYTVREQHYARLKAQLDRWLAGTVAVPGITTTVGRVATTATGAMRDIFSALGRTFDAGGYTPGGPIYARQGEFVLAPSTTRALERGLGMPLTQQRVVQAVHRSNIGPITVHQSFGDIGRYSPRQIESMVERAMVRVFQQLGA